MAGFASLGANGPSTLQKHVFLTITIFTILLIPPIYSGDVTSGSSDLESVPKCSATCKESIKYGFRPGSTSRYKYATEVRTFATGTSTEEEARVHLFSVVDITAITSCELEAELKDIQLYESDPTNPSRKSLLPNTNELIQALTKGTVRFTFQDGKVEFLCSGEDDEVWVLNIKRGIISLFQNSMDDINRSQTLQEVDINGKCLTKYEIPRGSPTGDGLVITKSKNLQSCGQRHSSISAIQSVPYSSASPIQNIPLLTGIQECSQHIRNHALQRVVCREQHNFQPFQNGAGGVKTLVTLSLNLESSRPSPHRIVSAIHYIRSGLGYEMSPIRQSESPTNFQELVSFLLSMEREMTPKVTPFAPEKFVELVERLRFLSFSALSSLYTNLPTQITRSLILDALPLIETAPSLTLMRELFTQGNLSETQVDSWLNSLTFIKHPSLELIRAIAPMLNRDSKNEALLAVGSVIHSYCQHEETCVEDGPVQEILQKLLSFLGPNCKLAKFTQRDLTRALFALKGIGNAGRLPMESEPTALQILENCFEEPSNPIETRVIALEAFRRVPCHQYNHQSIINIYGNMKEETEVRIMAYLMAMKCPDREVIETVKNTLYADSVNQVGSFVWTHLTNLQETTSPDKQHLKDLVLNDFLRNKFNTDARKFSRNYEGSMYWEEKNLGGGIDANIIFTPNSFLPRSATLNTSLYLFGETVNFLEVGGRIHSFEQLLESIFGPEGYFPEPHVNQALNSVRSRRDITSEVERLGSVFHQAKRSRDEELPTASAFLRIFGNEVSFKNFKFSHKQTAPSLIDENGRNWLDITYIFDNLGTGKSTDFQKSNVLLDTSYTVPTGSGIPLTLAVQAATTVGMKATGKLDLGNYWDSKELEIHGSLRPSAAIQVEGQMSIGIGRRSWKLRSGLNFQNSLHTATAMEAKVLIKGTNIMHASVSLPEPKQEILQIKSQLVRLSASGIYDGVIGGSPDNLLHIEPKCTPQFLSTAVGFKICGQTSIPDDWSFPILRPATFNFYLEKTDTFDNYEFDYKWIEDELKQNQEVSVLFNTPGSTVDRRLALAYSLDKVQGKLAASFDMPTKSLSAQAIYSKNAKNLQVNLRSRNEQILVLSTGYRQQTTRIEPKFFISFYGRPLIDVQGVLHTSNVLQGDGKVNVEISVKHITVEPIQLTGALTRQRDLFEGQLGIQSTLTTGTVRSHIRLRPDLLSSKSEVQYSWKGSAVRSFTFGGKFQKLEKGGAVKYSGGLLFNSPDFSHLNSDLSWESTQARGYVENNFKLLQGKSNWEGRTLYKNQLKRQQYDLQLLAALSAPSLRLDYLVGLEHHKNQSGMFTDFTGRLDSRNKLQASAQYLRTSEKLFRRNFNANIIWPGRAYSLKSGIAEGRPGEFEGELIFLPSGGSELKTLLTYKNTSNKRKQDYILNIRSTGYSRHAIIISGSFTASDRQSLLIGQIEVEGQAKWGTTLDYNASKRFSHRMGWTLDIDGKKYSIELNWRQSKSGDQIYTVDVNYTKHFYAEVQLKAIRPTDNFWIIATIIPDKEGHPLDKVLGEGKLTSDSFQLQLNYFEEVISIMGVYNISYVQFQVDWDEKRLAFLLQMPALTVERFHVIANIETPFDGYKNMGLTMEHTYRGNLVQARLEGHLEKGRAAIAFYGKLDIPQSTFSVMLDGSGFEKLSVVVKMEESGPTRLFELTTTKGMLSSVLKINVTPLQRSLNIKVDFSGSVLIPQFVMEFNRQKTSEVTDTLKLKWRQPDSEFQELQGRISYLFNPLKMSFSITTPYDNFEKVEGQISLYQSDLTRELKVYVNGPATFLPIKADINVGGASTREFGHGLVVSWMGIDASGRNNLKAVEVQTSARMASLMDSEFKFEVKIPNHSFNMKMKSSHLDDNGTGFKVHTEVSLDNEKLETGLIWLFGQLDQIKISTWLVYPNHPKLALSFQHLIQKGSYILEFEAGAIETSRKIEFKVNSEHEGWRQWETNIHLNSPFTFLPVIEISSKNDLRTLAEASHHTEFSIRNFSGLWGARKDGAGYVTFAMEDNGKKFKTDMFFLDAKYLEIIGEVERHGPTKRLEMSGFSPLLPDYQFSTGIQVDLNHGGQIYFNVTVNETDTSSWNSQFYWNQNGLLAQLHLDCPFGHIIQVNGNLDWPNRLLDLRLKETMKDYIDLRIRANGAENHGQLWVDLDGKGHHLLHKKSMLLGFKFNEGKLEAKGEYGDSNGRTTLAGLGVYTSPLKKLEFGITGKYELDCNLEINENRKVSGSISSGGIQMYNISGEYRLEEASEFSFGKHILMGSFTNYQTTNEFSCWVGLGTNRLIYQLSTPFDTWKDIYVSAEYQLNKPQKNLVLKVRRNSSLYHFSLTSLIVASNFDVEVEVNTPWNGYKQVTGSLKYENTGMKLIGNLNVALESSQFSLEGSVDSHNAELIFKTTDNTYHIVGQWNFASIEYGIVQVFMEWNALNQMIIASWDLSLVRGIARLEFAGMKNSELAFQYDLTDGYAASASVEVSGKKHEIKIALVLRPSEIGIILESPFMVVRKFEALAIYIQPQTGIHRLNVTWNLNNNSDGITAQISLSDGNVDFEAKSPLQIPWNEVKGTIGYGLNPREKTLTLSMSRGDQKEFRLSAYINSEGIVVRNTGNASLAVGFEFQSNVKAWENIRLDSNYDRVGNAHSGTLNFWIRNVEYFKAATTITIPLRFDRNKGVDGTHPYMTLRDLEVKLEILTPFRVFQRLTIGAEVGDEVIGLDFATPLENFPYLTMKLTGIRIFGENDFTNFRPTVQLGLPQVSYKAGVSFQLPTETKPGNFGVTFEQHYQDDEIESYNAFIHTTPLARLKLNVDKPMQIKIEVRSPYDGFQNFEIVLGGNLVWRHWAEFIAEAQLNNEKIRLHSQLRNEDGNRMFTIEVTTPFSPFEKLTISAYVQRYQDAGNGHRVEFKFLLPDWSYPFIIEADYKVRYKSVTDVEVEVKINLPTFDISPIAIRIRSETKDVNYMGLIEGEWGEWKPSVKFDSTLNPETLYTCLEAKMDDYQILVKLDTLMRPSRFSLTFETAVNYNQIFLFSTGAMQDEERLEREVRIKTPFEFLRTASAIYRLSPIKKEHITIENLLRSMDLAVGLSYNGKKLIHVELVNRNGKRHIEITNPIRPVSIAFGYDFTNADYLLVMSEACWDLNHADVSTIGFRFEVEKQRTLSFRVSGANYGYVHLTTTYVQLPKIFEQKINLKWNQPHVNEKGETGYAIRWRDESKGKSRKHDLNFQLDIPWRSIELETELSHSDKEEVYYGLLKWDVKRDPSKRIGGKFLSSKTTAWRSSSLKQVATLIHSALPHDIVLSLERKYRLSVLQGLSFHFIPTTLPQDTIAFSFLRDGVRNNEIRIQASHPANNLDSLFHMKCTDSTTSLRLSHMDVTGNTKSVALEATHSSHGSFLDIECSGKPLVQLELRPSNELPSLLFKIPTAEFNAELGNTLPLLKATLKSNSGREVNLLAGLPHSRELILKLSRNEHGMIIQDFLLSSSLNMSDIFSTQLHWRPDSFTEFPRFVASQLVVMVNGVLQEKLPKMWAELNEEINNRLGHIDQNFNKFAIILKDFTVLEFEVIQNEVREMVAFLQSIHEKNTFYTKDILEVLNSWMHKVYVTFADTFGSVCGQLRAARDMANSFYKEISKLAKKYCGRLEEVFMTAFETAEAHLKRLWYSYSRAWNDMLSGLKKTYVTIGHILDGNLEELTRTLSGLGIVRKIKALVKDYSDWIETLEMEEYLEEAKQLLYEKIWVPLEILYRPYIQSLRSVVEDGNLVALLEMPPLPYIHFLSSHVMSAANRFWIFVQAEQHVKVLGKIISKIDLIIQRHIPTATMIWDMEKGHIEYHQPLTFLEWNQFTDFPRLKQSKEDVGDTQYIQNFYFDILDTLRNTRPLFEFDVRDLLPPFQASALIAGQDNFLTFDGRNYQFSGDCQSYILISDLLDKNFTVLLNYEKRADEKPVKKSYTLITGNDYIEIQADSLLTTLNGLQAELPLTVGPTYVRRQPSGLEIIDTRGFQVKCVLSSNGNQRPAVCSFMVSGWYFGKLGGLLGNYDNEEGNDLRTPNGTIVSDITSFGHSWRVGAGSNDCQIRNYVETSNTLDQKLATSSPCLKMFNSTSSPLRPCFTTHNPLKFRHICQADISSGVPEVDSVCDAVSVYVMQCQRSGIDIWMPPECVRCDIGNNTTIRSGENVTYTSNQLQPPAAADIVLLVEEASSLSSYDFSDILNKLESALLSQGLQNNRYAVIGYGGQGPREKPHIQTTNGKVWTTMGSLTTPARSFMNGNGRGDLYEAIDYAATIGFRSGVSKTMIAIMASKNGCVDHRRYSDTLTLLLENDYRLHILTPEEFSLKLEKKEDEANKVYGIDMDGAFTLRQMKHGPIEGDKALRRQVRVPKDLCTPLALETTGTIFDLQLIQRPAVVKKFVNVWSRRLASTSQPSECQLCECLPNREGGATTLCQHCVSPSLQKFLDDLNRFEEQLESDSNWILPPADGKAFSSNPN